ncbi:MAG: two-component regulator propeller domain-containing protein, partial [Acidobacteriota bacterium]
GTDAGLNRWDRERDVFRHYRQRDGLPSDRVVGLQRDRAGHLWLATAGGLSRFDPSTERFRNYDVGDGLHGTVFYIGSNTQNARGELFFGRGGRRVRQLASQRAPSRAPGGRA